MPRPYHITRRTLIGGAALGALSLAAGVENVLGQAAWNANMLPEVADSYTTGNTGDRYADHIGATTMRTEPDNPAR
jgi:hypothetical protein